MKINPTSPLTALLPIAYLWVSVDGEFVDSILARAGILDALKDLSDYLNCYPSRIEGRKHLVIDVSYEWQKEHKSRFPQYGSISARKFLGLSALSNRQFPVTLANLVQVRADILAEQSEAVALGRKSKSLRPHSKGYHPRQISDNTVQVGA
jgi:hypothetical protein